MKTSKRIGFRVVLGMACLLLLSAEAFAQALYKDLPRKKPLASVSFSSGGITWAPQIVYESVVLRVTGQGRMVFEEKFGAGTVPFINLLDQDGKPLTDGQYGYELRFEPVVPSDVKWQMAALQESESRSDYVAELQNSGVLPKEPLVQSGNFRVSEGKIILPNGVGNETAVTSPAKGSVRGSKNQSRGVAPLDQVYNDDLIVTGSTCFGFDCLTDGTENFGFDTIKLKENNLRIFFEDTSTTAGFPANDWRIVVNDSASGGANYLAVEDSTAAKTPFKIEAGARTNALYLDSTSRIGVGTSTPVLLIHTVLGDTPSLRLDQDASLGWPPQVWDVAGNEANFFIRDTTNGSKLPFRIQPAAPTNTLTLKSSGYVGFGTWSPGYQLDVAGGTVSRSQLHFSKDGTDTGGWLTSVLDNNFWLSSGAMYDAGAGGWIQKSPDGKAVMAGSGVNGYRVVTASGGTVGQAISNPVVRLQIDYSGNVGLGIAPTHPFHLAGGAYSNGASWIDGSSREYKENIRELSTEEALKAFGGLNPVAFSYKAGKGEQHVGFIAEDVPELVATKDRKGLSPMDIVAVLTKVVQEQYKTNQEQQTAIKTLTEKLAHLEAKLEGLQSSSNLIRILSEK